jgi:hypothetical protein
MNNLSDSDTTDTEWKIRSKKNPRRTQTKTVNGNHSRESALHDSCVSTAPNGFQKYIAEMDKPTKASTAKATRTIERRSTTSKLLGTDSESDTPTKQRSRADRPRGTYAGAANSAGGGLCTRPLRTSNSLDLGSDSLDSLEGSAAEAANFVRQLQSSNQERAVGNLQIPRPEAERGQRQATLRTRD